MACETANVTDAGLDQVARGMGTVIKRHVGRPRIENPANKKGSCRGARQGTIEKARKACKDAGKKFADELERKLLELIEELAGVEMLKQIRDELESEVRTKKERLQFLNEKIGRLEKVKAEGPPPIPFDDALENEASRLAMFPGTEYVAGLADSARRLAGQYDGQHWQTVKQQLKKRVEEKKGTAKKGLREGE